MSTKKKKTAKKHKIAKSVPDRFHTRRKPEFEKALEEIPADAGRTDQDPGAGDSPMPPDDLARVDRELSKAAKALAPVLKIPFSIWASVSEIPEMKLADSEAEEWADPIVALLEYYFPGKIPEIAWMWLMFLSATEKVIDSRVKIRYEKRKEQSLQPSTPKPGYRGPAVQTAQPVPKHNGAEPAESYPSETS